MSSILYNKNVSNQSGINTDNINVNQSVTLPNINIDSVNGATFNGLLVCKSGIQLNSTPINYLSNYLGYLPTVILINSNSYLTALGNQKSIYSITLSPGVYNLIGQLEYYCFVSTSTINYICSSISLTNNTYNPLISNSFKGSTLSANESFIQQVNTIINISSNTTYYLISNINYSSGNIILKTTNATTTATTISSSQTGTTFTITATNNDIIIGLNATGTGINQPCYVIGTASTIFTFSTSQTIAATTLLTFTINNSSSFFQAVRIA